MLDFLKGISNEDAIYILKHDHDTVKDLFEQFEDAEDLRTKKRIAAKAIEELKIHAVIEEEIFYPAIRSQDVETDLMNEADEEHHVAKLLIAELDEMDGSEEHWEAKFTVLAENIRHHIREEEGEMFPQARHTEVDMEFIGRQLLARKQQLKRDGIPVSAEEEMVSSFRREYDSPAENARKNRAPKLVKNTKKTSKKAKPAAKKGSVRVASLVSKKGKANKAAAKKSGRR
jgi:hypothetical protein